MSYQPVIKYSGSKRSHAKTIISYFLRELIYYYEPVVCGASILYALLKSYIKLERYQCSDINRDLITRLNQIKTKHIEISLRYNMMWNELKEKVTIDDKRDYFNKIRDDYNKTHDPFDFLFWSRTSINGMIRYNKNGEFNASYHLNRDGIKPLKMDKILEEWSNLLNENRVEFICSDYKKIIPNDKNDFVYMDPPYLNTKGLYYGAIDLDNMYSYMRGLCCGYALSFNGKVKDNDTTVKIPNDLYDEQYYMRSGNSSFRRIVTSSKDSVVYESFYIKKYKK